MANISLTQEQERFLKRKVSSGRYLSVSEVVREALRLLEAHEELDAAKLEALRRDVSSGVRQTRAGDGKESAEVLSAVRAAVRGVRTAR